MSKKVIDADVDLIDMDPIDTDFIQDLCQCGEVAECEGMCWNCFISHEKEIERYSELIDVEPLY